MVLGCKWHRLGYTPVSQQVVRICDAAGSNEHTVRGIFNMTAVCVVEAQTRSIEHNIVGALDVQAG